MDLAWFRVKCEVKKKKGGGGERGTNNSLSKDSLFSEGEKKWEYLENIHATFFGLFLDERQSM